MLSVIALQSHLEVFDLPSLVLWWPKSNAFNLIRVRSVLPSLEPIVNKIGLVIIKHFQPGSCKMHVINGTTN